MSNASELTMTSSSSTTTTGTSSVTSNGILVSGFNFDNVQRNVLIEQLAKKSGIVLPNTKKTGTTIVGMSTLARHSKKCKDGVGRKYITQI